MEKMNQVSVSEFFAKSKEEMYDMAVEMVEKYNRLVDICNDSAERMAELMAKDDINEFKKELQSKVPGEFKIQKLADIVVWADGIIRDAGYNEEKYKSDGATAYCHVKAHELWRIRDVALESMERHTVYSNALNKDIADKAAKIELLEKEIEGRKAGYLVLKERMDSERESATYWKDKYIKVQEENNELKKESKNHYDMYKYGEELLKEKCTLIDKLKEENEKLKVDLIHEREKNEKLAKDHAELENDMRKYATDIISQSGTICNLKKELDGTKMRLDETIKNCVPLTAYEIAVDDLKKEVKKLEEENKDLKIRDEELTKQVANKLYNIDCLRNYITELKRTIEYYKNQERIRTDQLRATESKVEELWKEIDNLKNEKANMEDEYGRKGFKRYIKWLVKEEEAKYKESWKARLNEELEAIFKEEEETKKELNDKFGVGGIVDEFKEETEVKGNGRTSSGRYPWGAKVNDIPCGEDSIE